MHAGDSAAKAAKGSEVGNSQSGSGGKKKENNDKDGKAKKGRARSPTLHYSPTEEEKKRKKKTAVKAAPKPKSANNPQKTGTPPQVVKTSPTPQRAAAVKDSLNRAATVDIPGAVAETAPVEAEQDEAESDSESSGTKEDQPADPETCPQPNGPTPEQVEKKRQAHAMFMRFSRSLKRSLVAIYIYILYIYICVRW